MDKRLFIIAIFTATICSTAVAHDRVAVVPIGGTVGDAESSDVLSGKTFSSKIAGKGVSGVLEIRPGSEIYTNSVGMKFSLLPNGSFVMGSPDGTGTLPNWPDAELGRESDEKQHVVTLTDSFYMQATEVTQGQYLQVVGSNPSNNKACGTDCPVEKVSWTNAKQFIDTLNVMEGRVNCNVTPNNCYSLPTEAQWEYAARGGTLSAFYSGDITEEGDCPIDQNLDKIGWYNCNSGGQIHPVAQKEPNSFGLYDMSGNVYEWCEDLYGLTYPDGPVDDPTGPVSGTFRVVRGGAYTEGADGERSADRGGNQVADATTNIVGFRVILSLNQ